jgi:hypothetical protein
VLKALLFESRFKETRGKHHVAHMEYCCHMQYCSLESEFNEEEVSLTKWSHNMKPIKCPYVKQGVLLGESYDFDESRCDKLFDLLLQEKYIYLPSNHTLPSAEELKKKKWCKWHNATSHHINECRVFKRQIRTAIEQGCIKFEEPKRSMQVDGNPFPVIMIGESVALIKKYQEKQEREEKVNHEIRFNPH